MSDGVPASESTFPCSICNKTYKRREHLQRHAASHSTRRPYRCTFCNQSYQRADVLKRHTQTCQAKAKANVGGSPATSSSGRRACDFCVRQKKACSTGQPCENCRRKSVPCSYSFGTSATAIVTEEGIGGQDRVTDSLSKTRTLSVPGGDITFGDNSPFEYLSYTSATDLLAGSNADPSWLDFFNLASETFQSTQPQIQLENYSFRFLDNFTSRTGLTESFECGTLSQRIQVVSSFLKTQGDGPTTAVTSLGVPVEPAAPLYLDSTSASPLLLQTSTSYDPLIIKTHQILVNVKEVVTVKPRNSVVTLEWSTALEQRCLQFFSPNSIRKFLALYWEIWHPNVNFVHRPSFDPATSKSVLVAAMVLIGASISPDKSDNEQAKMWFNCVEEMVFTDDDFCNDPLYTYGTTVLEPATNIWKIQALQAAYIVCLYQNWEGTDASKRRIRRYRFSTVVSMARDIGIVSARHSDYFAVPQYEFDWKDFTAREQLIRTFLWIYLLDHAFVIFNNLPPRMVIKEMSMHMAWPEAIFQAATASDCSRQVHDWLLRCAPICNITFREVVENLCKDSIGPVMRRCFADLGPLNLFAAVSSFHSLIFQHQNSFGGNDQLQAIRYALNNWKLVWETYSNELSLSPPHSMVDRENPSPENMWRRIGFMHHSPEYWLLASLLLARLSRPINSQPSFDLSLVNGDGTSEPILSEYDQTSMRQVNDLIVGFQNVRLE